MLGETTLAVMPEGPYSLAMYLANATNPALAVAMLIAPSTLAVFASPLEM
jgi:predicted Na+-dependent transporter